MRLSLAVLVSFTLGACASSPTVSVARQTGGCGTESTDFCVDVSTPETETLSVRIEGGLLAGQSFGEIVARPEVTRRCVCACTCAPGSELGTVIVVRADGSEERHGSLGGAPMACCESR